MADPVEQGELALRSREGDGHQERCPVCIACFSDPRVLPCFHSFCRACIEQLVVADSEEEGIKCPLCRSFAPCASASFLPRNCTVRVSARRRATACRLCAEAGAESTPQLWCAQCEEAFCAQHAVVHALQSDGHAVAALSTAHRTGIGDTSLPTEPARHRLCADHEQPLTLYCVSCDAFVCGHCTAVWGAHSGHNPIQPLDVIVAQRRDTVQQRVDRVGNSGIGAAEVFLNLLESTIAELTTSTTSVREQICAAEEEAIEAIKSQTRELLQEANDIEEARIKVLTGQAEATERHLKSVRKAVEFGKKLLTCDGSAEDFPSLLFAVDKRLKALSAVAVPLQPSRHGRLAHQPVQTSDIVSAARQALGSIRRFEAHPELCFVEHEGQRRIAVHTVRLDGKPTDKGGDEIRVWQVKTRGRVSRRLAVTPEKDGLYVALACADEDGAYTIEVEVNGTMVPESLPVYLKKCLVEDSPTT